MKNAFTSYLSSVSRKFTYEETSEMGYRTDFEILLKSIFEKVTSLPRIDHDAKARQGNKPDFVILKHDIPILYIETKDIGISLDKIEKSEQMARYYGYANLVLTDYLEFRFYRNGQRYQEPIKIAEFNLKNRAISPLPENFEHAAKTLVDFTEEYKEPIKSGLHLAKIMGGKAQRIRDNLLHFLTGESDKNSEINKIYKTITKLLVHDLKVDAFADMYAQTLVYGLFVARYHDPTPDNFSRQEARDLVPNSNPFLRHFFDHIVGPDFDKRLEYIVNELCEVFAHANVRDLMKQYFKDDLWGKTHEGPDPVIHFYEDFLREYDPQLRKKLGAYYTPQPVVRFIVRSVDYLLKSEFGLPSGLADTTKLDNGTHKVQILDPAVGTGTFLSAVIRNIYLSLKDNNQLGRWPAYVHHDLLPRLHGFEIMMAPYIIAHLKLSMAFRATGFKHFNRRLGIYLTNSLEEADEIGELFTGFGFADTIAEESKEAAVIKNDTPIMVVIGNPPYSVSSTNKGDWILELIKDYKKDLNEKNIQPLSDDYIKFIRYAEHYIEKNKTGIIAMITNNTFLDGIIHRQMRKHLLETFDEIYILDLHGSSKKKETAPDGSKDENVFDIQQGVAVSIMVRKNENKEKLGVVKFAELYGKREKKFIALSNINFDSLEWKILLTNQPNYFFSPKDFINTREYSIGFKLNELFKIYSTGIKTHRDHFVIDLNEDRLLARIDQFRDLNISDSEISTKFKLRDNRDWKLSHARNQVIKEENSDFLNFILYRPFDIRPIYYSRSLIDYDRRNVMKHLLHNNICISSTKNIELGDYSHVFVSKNIMQLHTIALKETDYIFPLYTYDANGKSLLNLNQEIVKKIEKITGITEPEEILDYIYAVLHSPGYREKYKEFLKIDFPRVPYPKDNATFKKLVKAGTELRKLHLLESPKVNKFITSFPNDGSYIVEKPAFEELPVSRDKSRLVPAENPGNVWINKEQYFGDVPKTAWEFYIGGYQPAQKWLKDRKGRVLSNGEIEHYQKIIVALFETDRIMKEIDKIFEI